MRAFTLIAATATLLFGLQTASRGQQPVPKVLLVQVFAPVVDGVDLNVLVRSLFAREIAEEGRLDPIVWAMADPIFRKAVDDQIITGVSENPTLDQVHKAAAALKCEYVMTVRALRHGQKLMADAQLYRGRSQIWKDDDLIGATIDGQLDLESCARTIARTWVLQIGQTVLKHLVPQPKVVTPEPDPGSKPPVVTPPPPIRQIDNASLKAEYERLMKLNQSATALQLLRDSVDAEPLDLERRLLLISGLTELGMGSEASSEARRTANLFPESGELWRLCARAEIEAGHYAQAIRDLNEAVSRDSQNPETRYLLGIAQLMMGRLEFAIEHFDAAIAKSPSPEAHYLRGAAKGYLGIDPSADYSAASKLGENMQRERLAALDRLIIRFVATQAEAAANEMRRLIAKVRLDPKSKSAAGQLATLGQRVGSLAKLLAVSPRDDRQRRAGDTVRLALSLLGQSISEVESHIASPSEETITEATITLGEAFRSLESVRSLISPQPT